MKFGIIGCGKQAPKHISGLQAAGVQKIVVTDVNPDSIQQLLESSPSLEAAPDVHTLLNDPEVLGVSICTPTPSHAPLIREAIAAGKHFLCEKPLCDGFEEAVDLHQAAESASLIGMVGYVYRFVPSFETAYEILGEVKETGVSPILGRVTNAFFRIGGRGSHALWKHQTANGGGAINEMMVHMIDLATWLFGAPENAKLLKNEQRWPTRQIKGKVYNVDAEDWSLAILNHRNGIDALIQSDFITPAFTQYIEIQGENGSFFGSIQSDMPNFVFCVEPRGRFYAGRTAIPTQTINLFEAQMESFVKAVLSGQRPKRGSINDSINIMRTLDFLYK